MISKRDAKLISKKISEYDNIVIVKHQLPDWDAQGSAMGLAHLIEENWINKNIYIPGARLNDDQNFAKNFDQNTLSKALVITVDTGNSSRLDFDQWNQGAEIIKIDHHIPVENYGNYNIVDVEAVAAAQVIGMWAIMMKLKISKEAAENIYTGISTDSGRFLFDRTSPETMEVAKTLLMAGADLNKINKFLYVGSLKQRQWTNYAFGKMQLTKSGIAHIILEEKDYKKFDLSYDEVKSALSTMAGLNEIKIWFAVIEWEGIYKVSLRSRDYDVNSVAINYNGGGHKLASGAKLKDLNEVKKLIANLEKLLKTKKGIENEK
ncbi:DHH family phosphoesterase [Williamsoniiplasma luminosum]|uniref:Bifunctional oligoribonuclease/PAP phosphatase NrnA n=1 Tax=Williamsoniiplasma luminosum TaxID=214888 RepID=A0A2S0NKU8_9MOLU|nr:bifunctional oligoribonuclease/PAP phosphatase NrnA [Williamsoniiplasma luminosum]AVP49636.1 MAG: bifunctional oligoribonuclease/PAP phosphatase NrnA [Williamsoniiplasma luminosum]